MRGWASSLPHWWVMSGLHVLYRGHRGGAAEGDPSKDVAAPRDVADRANAAKRIRVNKAPFILWW